KAHVIAVDFLSPQFAEGEFDLIYAYGVLHHFPDLKILTDKLNEKLAPGGQIIAYDPLQTSTPIRIMRALYRPFQTDKDWEWPFTAKTLEWFASQFTVKAAHGMLGKSKYGLLVNLLPAGRGFKNRWISKAVKADWDATMDSRKMLSCMHLTMLLQKK
ncbi:MAG TPA: class I SAM-dependent methyltransferase, partial [Phnomibacter sp.]|nr:class I SAM-dependent methyltransferase [Phnomibacter sp.]